MGAWVAGGAIAGPSKAKMIKNAHILEAFERSLQKASPPDFDRNLLVFEGLMDEAKALGVWPVARTASESDWKIAFAGRLNVRRTLGQARPGA